MDPVTLLSCKPWDIWIADFPTVPWLWKYSWVCPDLRFPYYHPVWIYSLTLGFYLPLHQDLCGHSVLLYPQQTYLNSLSVFLPHLINNTRTVLKLLIHLSSELKDNLLTYLQSFDSFLKTMRLSFCKWYKGPISLLWY